MDAPVYSKINEGVGLLYTLVRGELERYNSPKQIQEIVARGLGPELLPVGTIIFIPWTDKTDADNPVDYDYPFVVEDYREITDANGNTHDAMIIRAYYATPSGIAFDAPEIVEETESTFQDGYYYYIKDGSDYVEQTVTAGDPIPSGTTYYRHTQSGVAGRIKNGSNRYSQSAIRQWMNSKELAGAWWTAQHDCDVAPAQATTLPGFMTGFTEEWLSIFQPIEVKTVTNTVSDGGVVDTTYDTFFLPSVSEMYGMQTKATNEGAYWEYEKDATGYESPTNGSSSNVCEARQIPALSNQSGAAVYVRLRTATPSNTYNTYYVSAAGYIGNSGASYAFRPAPACAIYESVNQGV